ncbi:uncharacterized protein LOC127240137 [Andrographis paniculata]|uniref:uncharacterized protein LOC127240137 n=1 Tax=Andrographis paniculata TaxID=175694 RepID=UPI0021E87A63|nr:uncharacterized protein LOC127240137 [Andrographis paniculata]
MAASSSRSGYSRGSRHQRWESDEGYAARPILDRGESSSSATTASRGFFTSSRAGGRTRPRGSGNSRSATRNRGGRSWLVKNLEKERPADSGGESSTIERREDPCRESSTIPKLDLDRGCVDGGDGVSGSASGLDRDSDNGEIRAGGRSGSVDVFDEDKSIRRLEELRLRAGEAPELSEEMLSANKQLQEDELLALESIYVDNIFILDDQSGLKCFQVHIHVEAPKGLKITAKFDSSSFQGKRDDDSSDFSYSFQVEYLSPIILTCLLPKLYPSKCPPLFTIYVPWLRSSKISELCYKLDLISAEQGGQEVIYQWVEWLHSSTLSYLGFEDGIVLGPYGVRHDADRRAISGSVSLDIDIPSIKCYNDEQHLENFSRNIKKCCICLSEFSGSEFIRLPCQHFFCEKCMKTFSDIHVKEGMIIKLKCPEQKCEGMIPPGLLKRLLGDEEFERWESLMLQKTLESMKDVFYCPRCETACLEDEDNHAQCSKCFYSFCTLCRERRHVGVTCVTPEMKLLILQERQNSTLMKDEQRRREQDMINQLLSMKEINETTKQCPSCKMAISRSGGCNKMVCDNCGQYFCYRCNKAISGYEHFRDGTCELFPVQEIRQWEERMNPQQIVGQIVAGLNPERAQLCPNCRQPNAKVGNNNHIFCWSCQNHYCYLCKKMVRRSSQHYGPKACKQHTPD